MAEKEVFFVGIRDPSELRRDLLGSVKKIVHSLKRYENINSLRVKKVELTAHLKKVLKEIAFLNNKLKALFPKTKLRALPVKKRTEIRAKASAKKGTMKKETSELNQLESELAEIEKSLGVKAISS